MDAQQGQHAPTPPSPAPAVQAQQLRSFCLLAVPFVAMALLLAPFALKSKSSEVDIDLIVSHVSFQLNESSLTGIFNPVQVSTLASLDYEDLELGAVTLNRLQLTPRSSIALRWDYFL